MKLLLLLSGALAFATFASLATEVQVVLVNGTSTDIEVEAQSGKPSLEVLPHESKTVLLRQPQWLRFGQEAYKYSIGPIAQHAKVTSASVVLQAHIDGKLYVVPSGTSKPLAEFPPQPKGFPLKPTRKADLT